MAIVSLASTRHFPSLSRGWKSSDPVASGGVLSSVQHTNPNRWLGAWLPVFLLLFVLGGVVRDQTNPNITKPPDSKPPGSLSPSHQSESWLGSSRLVHPGPERFGSFLVGCVVGCPCTFWLLWCLGFHIFSLFSAWVSTYLFFLLLGFPHHFCPFLDPNRDHPSQMHRT